MFYFYNCFIVYFEVCCDFLHWNILVVTSIPYFRSPACFPTEGVGEIRHALQFEVLRSPACLSTEGVGKVQHALQFEVLEKSGKPYNRRCRRSPHAFQLKVLDKSACLSIEGVGEVIIIKIIIINEPQYDPPWLRHCASISVPSITISIYFIYHDISLYDCLWRGTFTYPQHTLPAHGGKTREHIRYISVSLLWDYATSQTHKEIPPIFSPPKPVWALSLRLLPKLVTPHYNPFTNLTIHKDFLAK